ncbi:MAG: hypothetical protein IPH35_18605 [Rhodoferax sp.]|nr:hypothetical protein [Rhodoferax sp.]
MNWERFAGLALWNQALFVLLGLLLIIFAGMILRQLISHSLAVLVSKPDASRSKGWWMALGGVGLLALCVGSVVLQEYLHSVLGTASMVVSMGTLASGLYALADGVGILLFRREHGGVVMLIWGVIGGIVWLVVR